MMLSTSRCLRAWFLAMAALVLLSAPAWAAPYRGYADALLVNLPEGVQFRPDLEQVLAGLANAYRRGETREPVLASDLFTAMARAHAADMLLNDFVGHRASTGHDFAMRVKVMQPPGLIFRAIAEVAARDRQKGPADAAKARRLFQQWIGSRPHRKALLNRGYRYVSTGAVQRGNVICAVQIFWGEPRKGDGSGFFQ